MRCPYRLSDMPLHLRGALLSTWTTSESLIIIAEQAPIDSEYLCRCILGRSKLRLPDLWYGIGSFTLSTSSTMSCKTTYCPVCSYRLLTGRECLSCCHTMVRTGRCDACVPTAESG